MSDKREVRPIDANALCAILEAKADMALVPEYKHAFLNVQAMVNAMPSIDAEPVRHGRWVLEAHDERVNCRWNVTAECSECCDDRKEIWTGFFPGVPPSIARCVALESAESVKLSNYCPHCGAKMDGGKDDENA